ncbi:MAG: exodeoxyribonuclease VII large subunit [Bacteroidales bacterium]|jgi:exodeoxyribonuclease VII large subunit|nr:exodeoxyribonuclease VII large subunit [Bacteroidales bacterium]
MNNYISLLELNKNIQENIKLNFPEKIWLVAEISEIKSNRSGHCYLELIEKDVLSDNIIARARGIIWAYTYRMLKPYFENATGQILSPGIKILVSVSVTFHELYGYSLNITDIDPTYTLGDIARKKQETIQQLSDEGAINMNKGLYFPLVPQKIAVISSQTAAGYQDFANQLDNNENKYKYYHKLFPAIMQGAETEKSIINALDRIFNYENLFDIVVIIRGGGSQSDLNCFNNYNLAINIAQFPIPILTGIGHEKDESVADIVAYFKLKTPTAVAEYIISVTEQFDSNINNLQNEIIKSASSFVNIKKNNILQYAFIINPLVKKQTLNKKHYLKNISQQIQYAAGTLIQRKYSEINNKLNITNNYTTKYILNKTQNKLLLQNKFKQNIKRIIIENKNKITYYEKSKIHLDPVNILKRGYSITSINGNIIKNKKQIQKDDIINTKFHVGESESRILK